MITQLEALERALLKEAAGETPFASGPVTMASPTSEKVALFRNLFRGRDDVYPHRWENFSSGKAGYAPTCRNEWVRGVCAKPQVKCGECFNQAFVPINDAAIQSHLAGAGPSESANLTLGVYPLLPDETCWFLAADFDKKSWLQDVTAFRDASRTKGVPVAIERSRSGNGAHAWIFFSEPTSTDPISELAAQNRRKCPLSW